MRVAEKQQTAGGPSPPRTDETGCNDVGTNHFPTRSRWLAEREPVTFGPILTALPVFAICMAGNAGACDDPRTSAANAPRLLKTLACSMSTVSQAATLLGIAVGGALGALARYGVALAALAVWPGFPPAGTLMVNVAGCFVIGVLMVLAQAAAVSELARQFWVTGFLGALTTFSTFGWQTVELAREARYGQAALNVLANGVLGLAAVAAGLWLGKRMAGF